MLSGCHKHWPRRSQAGLFCRDRRVDHLAQHRRATEGAMGATLVKPSQLRLGDGDAQRRREGGHRCLTF
jgi:hypothetical protein